MESQRFEFGENWQSYLTELDEDRYISAKKQFTDWLPNVKGKTFLDVGSGSGLFSLIAYNQGARRIHSFDYDEKSVESTRSLWNEAGKPDCWTVEQGDVLSTEYMSSVPEADVVYSFGVLHHSGDMWTGLANSLDCVAPDGRLLLGLYNDSSVAGIGPEEWRRIKRFYLRSPKPVKRIMEIGFIAAMGVYAAVGKRRNPVFYLRNFSDHTRGMDLWHDARDWLGGLPYEATSVEEVCSYIDDHQYEFELVRVTEASAKGNNRFLFRRTDR